MIDVIAIVVIAFVVGGAAGYIIWAKKNGRRCIGCPDSKACSEGCGSCPYSSNNKTK